jgi:hypothetical protein
MKSVRLTLVLFALTVAAFAQKSDLDGKWTITWVGGGKPNVITLKDTKNDLSGVFINDSGESCSVSGFRGTYDTHGNPSDREVSLHIICEDSRTYDATPTTWDIQLDGFLTGDNSTINGTYLMRDKYNGKFRMDKK